MTWESADRFIGPNRAERHVRNSRATVLQRSPYNSDIRVLYHGTPVVTIEQGDSYVLQSNGYRTVTTKARINQYCPKAGLRQSAGVWLLADGSIFEDGVVIR